MTDRERDIREGQSVLEDTGLGQDISEAEWDLGRGREGMAWCICFLQALS